MNIFHWILIALFTIPILVAFAKDGQMKPEKALTYDAASTFWVAGAIILLVILSSVWK